MDPNSTVEQEEQRPALASYEDVARRLELTLTRPDLHEDVVHSACEKALHLGIAAVQVRPSDVDMAVRVLGGSGVAVASVAGYPHGSTTTAAKLYEGRDLLRRGVKELSHVVNIGKMISRQFRHVETEIEQIAERCRQNEAVLKIVFECGLLAEDMKIILCKICKRTGAQFVETDTGYAPRGYTLEDLALLKRIGRDRFQIKAGGAKGTLEKFTEAYNAGCDRYGSTGAFLVLEEWKKVLAEREAAARQAAST